MDTTLDQLERLAVLHRAGSLSDAEYEAQKARLLSGTASASGPPQPAGLVVEPALSKTWQRRFAFFRAHGSPFSPGGAVALQKLPFATAFSIRLNIWAFIFGPFYFFFLGLWKRGLTLMILTAILTITVERLFGDAASRAAGITWEVTFALTANYYRFIKVTQNRDEWNPLTDLLTGNSSTPSAGEFNP